MKIRPVIWDVIKISIALLILVSNCLFYYVSITGMRRTDTPRTEINDSLLVIARTRLALQDSLIKLDKHYDELSYKKDSVDRLNSTQRDDLRNSYRTRIQQRIRSGL